MTDAVRYVFLILGAIFGLLFCYSLQEIYRLVRPKLKFTGHMEKFSVLNVKENLTIVGGELDPDYYDSLVEVLRKENQGIKVEFFCGPTILVNSRYREYLSYAEGQTSNIWEYHPLFRFAKEHPERLKIYIRSQLAKDTLHYSVGTSPKLISIVDPRTARGEVSGYFYFYDVARWQFLKMKIAKEKEHAVPWDGQISVKYHVV